MNIFIPALKDVNPFFDEIMFYSRHNFIFDDYKNYKTIYKIVLIHWPETIFKNKEPSSTQLDELKEAVKFWQKHSKIFYVVHNLERHHGMTSKYEKLYNLLMSSCDSMLHFGNYSKELLEKKYPFKQHEVIFHPLYKNSFKLFLKDEAREQLGYHKDSLIILVPGCVRNKSELNLTLRAFKGIANKNKVLLVSRLRKKKLIYDFKGRVFLKKYLKIDVKALYEKLANNSYMKAGYKFNYKFLEFNELSLMLSAADIVFIPRIKILNSGNIFLGMTFKKIMIGPNRGNITEVLTRLKLPMYNPEDSKSVKNALQKGVELYETSSYRYDEKILKEYDPVLLAKKWDEYLS
ncbi:hypothetical protein ACS386_11055 [Flavobacteriaceae bacterium LMO-SS05]